MIKVLNSGFYTTIQDKGRFGYRDYGVPVSGVMDKYSSRFANALLGNPDDAAVIEMTMVGGTFLFSQPTVIAISGADMKPNLNNKPIKGNCAVRINPNDVLSFGKATKGFRTYMAIKNGLKTDYVLKSRSQYKPITKKSTIAKGNALSYTAYDKVFQKLNAIVKYDNSILESDTLEVYKGPEFNRLSDDQKEVLLNSNLVVSRYNNRMAYQLEPLFKNNLKSILTSPVLPGTVQLTPSGNLIVLMLDCQSTGGYPRVLQLTEKAINILSQKTTGSSLKVGLKE